MTTKEIIETLARFEDYYLIEPPEEDGTRGFSLRCGENTQRWPWHETQEEAWADAPNYHESRDALAGVLGRFSDEQWRSLHINAQGCEERRAAAADLEFNFCFEYTKFLLTLPPSILAEMAAKVINETTAK